MARTAWLRGEDKMERLFRKSVVGLFAPFLVAATIAGFVSPAKWVGCLWLAVAAGACLYIWANLERREKSGVSNDG